MTQTAMSIGLLSWEQTLEGRKRLDNIREVEQENLKFNRASKNFTMSLTEEKPNQ